MLANGATLGYRKHTDGENSAAYTDLPGLKEIPEVGVELDKEEKMNMLKGTKSMNLSYSSIIDGKSVVYMSAQVPETGKSNCTKTIQDQEMYEANKAECRKDMAAFDELLWKLEDQGTVDTAKNTDTEEQRA